MNFQYKSSEITKPDLKNEQAMITSLHAKIKLFSLYVLYF